MELAQVVVGFIVGWLVMGLLMERHEKRRRP